MTRNYSDDFFYIENYKALKLFLETNNLQKYRSQFGEIYNINGLMINRIGKWTSINFIPSSLEISDKFLIKTFLLDTDDEIKKFRLIFKEILDEKELVPYFLKFSEAQNDNILINYETKQYLINLLKTLEEERVFEERSVEL